MNIQELNKKFAIKDELTFVSGKGGWPYAHINNKYGKAIVSIYGAQVLSYIPQGEMDVLWDNNKCFFEKGNAMRAGIPVCWPWFGRHPTQPEKPSHGFARLSLWEVLSASTTVLGETELVLSILDSAETEKLWPYAFSTTLTVTLGSKLTLELNVTNTGNNIFTCTSALHTYFKVGDASQITIKGLGGCSYHDSTEQDKIKLQEEDIIKIPDEVNRAYINTSTDCIITDPVLHRKIRVAKKGSNTTVVWNPWIKGAKSFADMDDAGYKTMVCIEAANAYNEIITINPGQSYSLATILNIE